MKLDRNPNWFFLWPLDGKNQFFPSQFSNSTLSWLPLASLCAAFSSSVFETRKVSQANIATRAAEISPFTSLLSVVHFCHHIEREIFRQAHGARNCWLQRCGTRLLCLQITFGHQSLSTGLIRELIRSVFSGSSERLWLSVGRSIPPALLFLLRSASLEFGLNRHTIRHTHSVGGQIRY